MNETIVAIATGDAPAGVGIVRISGPDAHAIARQLTELHAASAPGHTLRYTVLRHPKTGERVDDGLLAIFHRPASFTGEDTIEWQGHGGRLTLARVVDAALAAGARHARPGEFSERAFHNGKLDLAQAEAIASLVMARTEAARRAARRQLVGELSRAVETIADALRDALARIEASIDFPEEVGEIDPAAVGERLTAAAARTDALLATAGYGRRLDSGLTVALAGAPNAGKSSLLNALAGVERAIVTEVPGTTRDTLNESLHVGGIPITLTDTAGLRDTDDPVEKIGVERARRAHADADLVLAVIDATTGDLRAVTPLLDDPRTLAVVNKIDAADPAGLLARLDGVAVSARTGEGLETLRDAVLARVGGAPGDGPLVTAERHERALRDARTAILRAQETLASALPAELIAVDAHAALQSLGELTGATAREDVIAGIFARFCLGK